MIHLYGNEQAADYADKEINIFCEEGVDGFILENYHGSIANVREVLSWIDEIDEDIYKGVNILPNEITQAYELAAAYKLDFIQFDFVAGTYKGASGNKGFDWQTFIRFRERFPEIKILGGVWPKYYHPIEGSDLMSDIDDGKRNSDAIVVTGAGTGKETPLDKVKRFRKLAGDHPLIVGAGLTPGNVAEQLTHANGAIVGSCFKKYNKTTNPIDRGLVKEFMNEVNKHRVKTLL